MKTLYLLRHAKSDWENSSITDFDRPLNDRGWRAAKAVGHEMRERDIAPDLVFVSPAVRTRETLARVEEGFGGKFETVEERAIYLAEAHSLLELVRRAPVDSERVMIVGHNPAMHELALLLVEGPRDLREDVAYKFPTAALAEISFDIEDWRDLSPGSGRIRSFVKPRDP
ncbi:SixA phosphatase family protein [Sphingomonas daechungensis]|uniref:SixA phosphatase family protein n=1 Tax=Sphingomonas daechungensis TaxID=1176646 RepID=UPI003783C66C